MVDSHHKAAAQTNQADDGLERATVRPEIHDADLGLGEAVGGLDDGLEADPLLQKIEVTVSDGDGVEFVVRGGKLNSLACEGVQGFEEEVFALMRKYQLGWPAHSTSRSSR